MQYTQLSRRSAGGKIDWEKQYLTFIPVEDAMFSWAERAVSGHLEYSVNGGQTWVTIADGESTPTITTGSKIMWRGDLVPQLTSSTNVGGIGTFSATGNYKAHGNIMSLLYYDNYYNSQLNSTKHKYVFYTLFKSDTHLLSAPLLTSTTLADSCYYAMFKNCTGLTTAPKLPATTLVTSCYSSMFHSCTSLMTAPELPAMKLANNCYGYMFSGCTSLVTAPELPVTTLAIGCYDSMFYGCKSLTVAPELPATALAISCYVYMFNGCTSLVTAPELPATKLEVACYCGMFLNCTSLMTAPELPAMKLINRCYENMFSNCTKLNYIKCLTTDISASSYTTSWVTNVASTGTFVKAAGMEDWPTGASGIPSGWTVVDDNS